MASDCEARGGCVYVKVRPDEEVKSCKDCGASEPEPEIIVHHGKPDPSKEGLPS